MASSTLNPGALRGVADDLKSNVSYWARSAAPLPAVPRLESDLLADVVIVGGGFTGLSAAHFLAKSGQMPVVLDANGIGWGASGRNGGFVSTRFRYAYSAMAKTHGIDIARRMYGIALEAADTIEEIVGELGISCGYGRHGSIVGAHNDAALATLRSSAAWMRDHLGEQGVESLDKDAIKAFTGSGAFVGGSLNRKVGGIHPLNYVRGLAKALLASGVRLFERTPVISIERIQDGVLVRSPLASVKARHAVIATNAYSDLTRITPALKRSVVPFQSAVIATAPLPQSILGGILPNGQLLSDTRRVLRWARIVDGRLLFGGRGAFGDGTNHATYRRMQRQMEAMFPQVAGCPLEFRWSGYVAMTMDKLPHIGRSSDRVHYALGYNGTGVAMSNLMGRYIAKAVNGESIDLGLLEGAPPPIPLHALRAPAIRAATAWMQALDHFS